MKATTKKNALTWLKEGGIYVVLLVLLAIIIFQDPTFLMFNEPEQHSDPIFGAHYYCTGCGGADCYPGY